MIFYEEPDYSWIEEGVRFIEHNSDIVCLLPRGGPPTHNDSLHQGTTEYKVDQERRVYLFKNFTSRHYLVHRKRFLELLPMKPIWLSWRENLKSKLWGNGKMLCWESIVGNAIENSRFWRADLMNRKAWSIHPGERTEKFHKLLPGILERINLGEYPNEQAGQFDLNLESWEKKLNEQKDKIS